MTFKTFVSFLLLLSFSSIFSQTYITNVTVADVTKHKLIKNQTVEITDDIITNIKAAKKLKVPSNATTIDGSGKFLFPGLTDAHIHFFQSGGLYARPDAIDLRKEMPYHKELDLVHTSMENTLKRYLQIGVTNVIDVGASYSFLKQRAQFENNNHTPSIYDRALTYHIRAFGI